MMLASFCPHEIYPLRYKDVQKLFAFANLNPFCLDAPIQSITIKSY